ncbi:hypothetical protein [Actinacidiphila sp. ITFR-21]|uniref:hypothetical protein n=1 Tax=Actinacidiphila sp. ITFR-21 TaxID=3075199 RepID=UPI00288BD51D|nr:hypothetical protein [Streptomyces sp. ITFR-21]WNI17590.1 hypothetical protein RLT57_20085 [Streptomyces sp. ITFR-21]WNI17730.1 hypothetical protein RLT57_20800 [Streptomyces sp. ITFR-21]
MLRAFVIATAVALISAGGFLVLTAQDIDTSPARSPRPTPAMSIGPNDAEPAWTHVCLGTDDDPSWC